MAQELVGSGSSPDITALLSQYSDFRNFKVRKLGTGFSRTLYALNDSKGRVFVAKLGHAVKDSGSSIAREVIVLQFLRKQGVSFTPEIRLWDKNADLSIESCAGTRDVPFNGLDKVTLAVFADQLYQVHSLPVGPLQRMADAAGVTLRTSELEHFKTYGQERLNIARASCPDQALIRWLEDKLAINRRIIVAKPARRPHLVWGDIGENLRTDGLRLFFIDWEHAHLGRGSELAYIKVHSHVSPRKFNAIVARYAQISGVSERILRDEIARDEQVTRVNDVVWAAMKWGQASSAAEAARYKKLTYARRDQASRFFAES